MSRVITYLDAERGSSWCVTLHNAPLCVNQKLGEIPFDIFTEEATFAGL
jgi:hypothetical protein